MHPPKHIQRLLSDCVSDAGTLSLIDATGAGGYRATDGRILCVVGDHTASSVDNVKRIDPATWEDAPVPKGFTAHGPYPSVAFALEKARRGREESRVAFAHWLDGAERIARTEQAEKEAKRAEHKAVLTPFRAQRAAAMKTAKAQVLAARAALKPLLAGLTPVDRNRVRAEHLPTRAADAAFAAARKMVPPPGPAVPCKLEARPVRCPLAGDPGFGFQLCYLRAIKRSGILSTPGARVQFHAGVLLITDPTTRTELLLMPVSFAPKA